MRYLCGETMNFLSDPLGLLAVGMPGPTELILILVIVLVVFGHNRIPQLGEALGKGIRNFKKSFSSDETEAEARQVKTEQVTESQPSESAKIQQAEKTEA